MNPVMMAGARNYVAERSYEPSRTGGSPPSASRSYVGFNRIAFISFTSGDQMSTAFSCSATPRSRKKTSMTRAQRCARRGGEGWRSLYSWCRRLAGAGAR